MVEHWVLADMIRDGDCYLEYAAKGAGKTSSAMTLGWALHRFENYFVTSNTTMEHSLDGE